MKQMSPWAWVPTLYLAEGVPYVLVMTVSAIFYKTLGMDNAEVAFYTTWLNLPWLLKPLWSPLVDRLKTKRWWFLVMQWLISIGLAAVAFTISTSFWLQGTLALFFLIAVASATHDIAADGYYMLALTEGQQAAFVGIRSTFYRIATICGQGLLTMLAGWLSHRYEQQLAWALAFGAAAVLFCFLLLGNTLFAPRIEQAPVAAKQSEGSLRELLTSFFTKPGIGVGIAFLLLFRLSEALLLKINNFFFLDMPAEHGLGLSVEAVGFAYGTVGIICLTIGGIVGGLAIAHYGLKRCMLVMALSISLPNLVYVVLSYFPTQNLALISTAVGVEQFGYGFGFTAYMMYMIFMARGRYETSHYAFCTLFMTLSTMLPGFVSGWIEEQMGYQNYFWLVFACTLPILLLLPWVKLDENFGRKQGKKA